MKAIQYKTLILTLLIGSGLQSFFQGYTYSRESGTFTELVGGTMVEGLSEEEFQVDLDGEKFLVHGEIYRADGENGLAITQEGQLIFNDESTIGEYLFSGSFIETENTEVSYLLEGEKKELDRVFKVEFKRIGFNYGSSAEFMTFQLWVFPNTGDLEIHVGPQFVDSNNAPYVGFASGPAAGVLRVDTAHNFLNVSMLGGTPSSAYMFTNFTFMEGTPAEGDIMKFDNIADPLDHSIIDDDDDDNTGGGNNGGGSGTWPVGIIDGGVQNLGFTLYPNPTVQQLNIELNDDVIKVDPVLFQIISIDGRVIEEIRMNNNVESVNVSQYSNGIYFIQNKFNPSQRSRFLVAH